AAIQAAGKLDEFVDPIREGASNVQRQCAAGECHATRDVDEVAGSGGDVHLQRAAGDGQIAVDGQCADGAVGGGRDGGIGAGGDRAADSADTGELLLRRAVQSQIHATGRGIEGGTAVDDDAGTVADEGIRSEGQRALGDDSLAGVDVGAVQGQRAGAGFDEIASAVIADGMGEVKQIAAIVDGAAGAAQGDGADGDIVQVARGVSKRAAVEVDGARAEIGQRAKHKGAAVDVEATSEVVAGRERQRTRAGLGESAKAVDASRSGNDVVFGGIVESYAGGDDTGVQGDRDGRRAGCGIIKDDAVTEDTDFLIGG